LLGEILEKDLNMARRKINLVVGGWKKQEVKKI